jgi:hypothetical protein
MKWPGWKAGLGGSLVALLLGSNACSRSGSQGEITPSSTPSIQEQRAARAAEVPRPIQERWDYLNRIRQADTYDVISRTRVDDQNQLGVVLAANLTPEQTEELMKKALEAVAKKFPAEDVTLDAYAPTNPLRKLGTARYNAQNRQVTYTPL